MMKNLVGKVWAKATQVNLEVTLKKKKNQFPKDSQARVSCWGQARGQKLHCVQTGTHLALAMAPGWRPALLADLPEAKVRFLPA